MSKIRLQVALAKAGVASRRKSAEIVAAGCVKVNGKTVTEKGFRVDTSKDRISFNGSPLHLAEEKHYYVLNKPAGVLSTAKDERGRKKVSDFVAEKGARLYPIGRLDKDTTGLIILTNDGDLTYRLTHPKFGVNRVYEAGVEGSLGDEGLERLKKGLIVDGKFVRAEKAVFKKKFPEFAVVLITLREGRKREVRNMFDALGCEVVQLKRISYCTLKLKGLKEGSVRPLTVSEIRALKHCVGLI